MKKNRLFNFLVCGLLILLTACQAAKAPLEAAMPQPVEEPVNGIRLTTGAAEAPPLWAFCEAAQENTHIRTFYCRVPAWQDLAIGYAFLLADSALVHGRSADLEWDVAIDDTLVDLESFGTYDYVMPAMPGSPSRIRKVFVTVTDWNLVMTNTNPGEHTLYFRAKDSAGYHCEWLVHLSIEGKDRTDISSIPFPLIS